MSPVQSLKESGLKATLPRRKILELFEASKVRHLSADDVCKQQRVRAQRRWHGRACSCLGALYDEELEAFVSSEEDGLRVAVDARDLPLKDTDRRLVIAPDKVRAALLEGGLDGEGVADGVVGPGGEGERQRQTGDEGEREAIPGHVRILARNRGRKSGAGCILRPALRGGTA